MIHKRRGYQRSPFTRAMWDQWLAELNAKPVPRYVEGLATARALLHARCISNTTSEKVIHLGKYVASNGSVSALCFSRPRAIDLVRASWTNRPSAVTCKKCIAKCKQAKR